MSTRPGSKSVSIKEELERTIPLINYIKKNHDILISIDTVRSEVAENAVKKGRISLMTSVVLCWMKK